MDKSEVLRLLAPRDFYEKHGRPFHPDCRVTPEEIKAREAFVAREADDARKAAAIAPRKRSARKPVAAYVHRGTVGSVMMLSKKLWKQ